jgi:hypothetical protein
VDTEQLAVPGRRILESLATAVASRPTSSYPEYGDANYGDGTGYTDTYGDDDT